LPSPHPPPHDARPISTVVTFTAKEGSSTFLDAITHAVHSIDLNGTAIDTSAADGKRIQIDNLAADNVLTIDADMAYTNTGEGLQDRKSTRLNSSHVKI